MMSNKVGNEGLSKENHTWVISISDDSDNSNKKISQEKPLPSSSNKEIGIISDQTLDSGSRKKRKRGHPSRPGADSKMKGKESDHEMHVWTERERRKKMQHMFGNLLELLPQISPKADKSTIVSEAVNYIKTLQQTLENLEKQKREKLQGLTTSANEPSASSTVLMIPQKVPAANPIDGSITNLHLASSAISNQASASASSAINDNMYNVGFQTWTSSNVVLNVCGDEAQLSVFTENNYMPRIFTTICYVLEKHKIEVVSAQVSSISNRRMYMILAQVMKGAYDQSAKGFQVAEIFREAASEISFWISSP